MFTDTSLNSFKNIRENLARSALRQNLPGGGGGGGGVPTWFIVV